MQATKARLLHGEAATRFAQLSNFLNHARKRARSLLHLLIAKWRQPCGPRRMKLFGRATSIRSSKITAWQSFSLRPSRAAPSRRLAVQIPHRSTRRAAKKWTHWSISHTQQAAHEGQRQDDEVWEPEGKLQSSKLSVASPPPRNVASPVAMRHVAPPPPRNG